MDIIDTWLIEDKDAPKKQRHTARRVFNRLKEEHGYMGAEVTVRRYVRQAKQRLGLSKGQAGFIPLDPECGLEAEVDWGVAMVCIRGKQKKVRMFCLRSKYSGKFFVQLYPCERQQIFFEAHIEAFSFFGGIFKTIIYDNLTTAVRKVLQGKDRILQKEFEKFRSYYSFESRFCSTAQGHEKGGVENLVGFARRNFLVPIPKGDSLAQINEELLKKSIQYGSHTVSGRTKNINELFLEEQSHLLPLPNIAYSNIRILTAKADKYCTVRLEYNRYSVPSEYTGRKINVEMGAFSVLMNCDRKCIAKHKRNYARGEWILNPDHYLDLLHRRPRAFESARPIKQWRRIWPANYETLLNRFQTAQGIDRGIKDFVTVLCLHRDFESNLVDQAIATAVECKASSSDAIIHLLDASDVDSQAQSLDGWDKYSPPDIGCYDQLGGVS